MSSINIDELEVLFKLVMDKLKKDQVKQIEFAADEYWIITSDEWVNLKNIPKPAVGSLAEDVEYLKRAIEEKEIVTYSDLDRLSTVLRFISEIQAPINS
jgi:hypothetical protein